MENYYNDIFMYQQNNNYRMNTPRQYLRDGDMNVATAPVSVPLNMRRRGSPGSLTLSIPMSNWCSGPSSLSPSYSACEPVRTPTGSPKDYDKPRYKTELCKRFTGCCHCEYGGKCQYAHGSLELRLPSHHPKYKSQYCEAYHKKGSCLYGRRCDFIHSESSEKLSEIRYLINLFQKYRNHFPYQGRDVTIHELIEKARIESEREEEMYLKSIIHQQALRQQMLIDSFLSAPFPSMPSRKSYPLRV